MDNEDKLLIQEYCYIRTKQEHKAPDVKKAWDQFEHEHIMKKQNLKAKRRVMLWRHAAAIPLFSSWQWEASESGGQKEENWL